jgi:hypothetical protein
VDRRGLWLATIVLLAVGSAFVAWFDYAALTSFLHPVHDAAGNTRFQVYGYSNQVYPFTYLGVALSGIGVALFVYRSERSSLSRPRALLLSLGIANLASVGMVDVYEQLWLAGGYLSGANGVGVRSWLGYYWGTVGGFSYTLAGLLLVFVVLPWCRRSNLPGVLLLGGVGAASFLLWSANGYGSPASGNPADYALNATSRIALQLLLVAAVSSIDVVAALRQGAAALRRGLEREPKLRVPRSRT